MKSEPARYISFIRYNPPYLSVVSTWKPSHRDTKRVLTKQRDEIAAYAERNKLLVGHEIAVVGHRKSKEVVSAYARLFHMLEFEGYAGVICAGIYKITGKKQELAALRAIVGELGVHDTRAQSLVAPSKNLGEEISDARGREDSKPHTPTLGR
ncbi:MAG TPA: hypothetical protein PKA27_15660 [Fimbriimonadaceae bacterium]|nr:hypothetical protein [Fimbriimonadaceae bacterium]